MEKILSAFMCLIFAANIVCAQEAFLSLTKYSEPVERLPTNITIISQEDIRGSFVKTLGELLENEVGIFYMTTGTAGAASSISIRGASSLQTLVLIDGRRVNDIGLGSADFTSIPISIIERVEIIRGAGASVYGTSAFGGVINVITKKAKPDSPLADAGLSYGAFNTLNNSLTAAYHTAAAAALVSLSGLSSDGHRENSEFDGKNMFASVQTVLSRSSKLSFTGNIYASEYGVPGSTSWLTPENTQKDDNKYAKLDYNLKIDDSVYLNVSGYMSQNIRTYYDATGNAYDPTWTLTESKYKYNSGTYGAQADFHYKETLLIGAEWLEENYRQKEELSGYDMEKSRVNNAGYAQLKLSFFDKLTLIPGVRYDNNSQYGDVAAPSVSAVYNAAERVKVSANSGKVWRAPVFTELYWYEPNYGMYGNPDLNPEYGISSDAGVEFSFDKIKLAGTLFYIASKDLIAWEYNPATFETHVNNIEKARQYGIEFEAGYIMTSWLSHKLNYTYLNAENEDTKKRLTYKPDNMLNYTVTVKPLENILLSGSLSYKDKVFTDAANTSELDEVLTLNVDVKYRLNENITLWSKALNVGNVKYEISSGYPMPGAAVYAGFDIKLWK